MTEYKTRSLSFCGLAKQFLAVPSRLLFIPTYSHIQPDDFISRPAAGHLQRFRLGSIFGVRYRVRSGHRPTRRAIPECQFKVTDPSTNITLTTKTNEAGRFIIPNVNPGTYDITFSKAGFSTRKVNQAGRSGG